MVPARSLSWFALVFASFTACATEPAASGEPVADTTSTSHVADAATPPDEVTDAALDDRGAPSDPPVTPSLAAVPPSLAAVIGRWYLNVAGARAVASLAWDPVGQRLAATISDESASALPAAAEVLSWTESGELRLRVAVEGGADWYRLTTREGVLTGRVARGDLSVEPELTRYTRHASGWNADWIDRGTTPRAWDITLDGALRATLRIDGDAQPLRGTLKVYATVANGIADEDLERDLTVTRWDGVNLAFEYTADGARHAFTGVSTGRTITGTWFEGDGSGRHWMGSRVDVLGYGITARDVSAREAWQRRVRAQLSLLLMAGNPAPLSLEVTRANEDAAPFASGAYYLNRDDAPDAHPQAYRVTELRFRSTVPNPYGSTPLTREAHGYVARPTGEAPAGGFTVAVAVNGHWGSARQVMSPDSPYWYGDAFARRGYVVVAVDISHRPLADRRGLYADLTTGDDAPSGNTTHPAIAAPGMDTDWEEDGERAYDVMRAIDYATSLPGVDPERVVLVGLSMGGEVTTIAGALDPRVTAVVPTGFSPDVFVYRYRHHPCWDWASADVNEYVDVSDYHALVAPRALVVETGLRDTTYSIAAAPFGADKQVLRRSRLAFTDAPSRVTHYLHFDDHAFHVGDASPFSLPESGVRVPVLDAPDLDAWLSWQTDRATTVTSPSLFDLLDAM